MEDLPLNLQTKKFRGASDDTSEAARVEVMDKSIFHGMLSCISSGLSSFSKAFTVILILIPNPFTKPKGEKSENERSTSQNSQVMPL